MWFLLDTSVVYTVSGHQFQPVLILTLLLSYSQSFNFGLSVDCFVVVCWCWISWRTEHNSSLCFLSSSVTTEEPETRQHRHTARHHPHRTLPHSGVWVSCEYIMHFSVQLFIRSWPELHTWNMDLFECHHHCGSCVFQDSDLKQYLDNCGNLMSMHNVKVSHRHDSALSGVKHYWLYTRERDFMSVQRHNISP